MFGGRSSEHAVSCATAASVLEALDRDRYDVIPVGIARDGHWVLAPDDPSQFRLTAQHTPHVDGSAASVIVPTSAADQNLIVHEPGQSPRNLGEVDVIFPLLHGPFGEDGTIQGMLDLADVRYVGSGVTASATMMDKAVMKTVFTAAGLPVGPYVVITDKAWRRDPQAALTSARASSGSVSWSRTTTSTTSRLSTSLPMTYAWRPLRTSRTTWPSGSGRWRRRHSMRPGARAWRASTSS